MVLMLQKRNRGTDSQAEKYRKDVLTICLKLDCESNDYQLAFLV